MLFLMKRQLSIYPDINVILTARRYDNDKPLLHALCIVKSDDECCINGNNGAKRQPEDKGKMIGLVHERPVNRMPPGAVVVVGL